jgi:hypothetical protein
MSLTILQRIEGYIWITNEGVRSISVQFFLHPWNLKKIIQTCGWDENDGSDFSDQIGSTLKMTYGSPMSGRRRN